MRGPSSAALVMAREQRVFHVEGNLAELLTPARFGGDAGALDFKPNFKIIPQWFGFFLPRPSA
jgi:hypothetical protein